MRLVGYIFEGIIEGAGIGRAEVVAFHQGPCHIVVGAGGASEVRVLEPGFDACHDKLFQLLGLALVILAQCLPGSGQRSFVLEADSFGVGGHDFYSHRSGHVLGETADSEHFPFPEALRAPQFGLQFVGRIFDRHGSMIEGDCIGCQVVGTDLAAAALKG